MLASIRPDSINIALLVHVAGAMALVGSLVTASTAALIGWRDEANMLSRLAYKTLLYVALPSYIVMRVGAQWTYAKEKLDDLPDQTWVDIGFITSDLGGLLLLIALIVGGVGLRRSRTGGGRGLLQASSVIATLLVAAYIVAIWAMGAKPT
ncbi:MAG TPA: hypothetical protein VM049_03030 [Gaiellaceae bacterium]|nr:hypothetical protein [Gaiellaceae bacterium]